MRIAGTNRFYPIPTNETEALSRGPIPMPRVGVTGGRHDDSDGDSSASLEEISAEDFKQDNGRSASRSRVWMGDLMRYPMSRNFAPDLYSFAWAQAVQNKPLGFDLAEKKEEDELDCDNVVIEDSDEEKEEGEIEEGEIDLGSEVVGKTEVPESEKDSEMNKESEEGISAEKEEEKEEIGDFDRRVGTILEELDAITEEETETSFESVCSRLLKCFASLKEMFAEDHVPVLDALVQQSFMGIQTVCSVFSSGKLKNKEQNKDLLLRLLVHIKNQYSLFLKPEQVKEIDSRLQSLVTETASIENNKHARSAGNVSSYSGLVSSETPNSVSRAVNAFGSSYRGKAGLPGLELPSTSRSRVDFSPLLDLHADYDEGSLPSPTRDNAPPLPTLKPIGFGMPAVRPTGQITPKVVQAENGTLHPYYVTDAFKAVSSYQQKYGRTSFDATNRLPSPTPSEDGNDDDDAGSEVSSYSAASDNRNLNKLNVVPPVASSSSAASIYSSSGPQLAPVRPAVQLSTGPNSVTKAPAKSRDPRLRFMNSEVGVAPRNENLGGSVNSRKQKAADESVLDENSMKRQRNGSLSYTDARVASGSGGWIEDNGVAASQTSDRIQMVDSVRVDTGKTRDGEVVFDRRLDANTKPSVSSGESLSNTAVSLPFLLKDFAVNPTMLMQLLKMEQQRQAAEVQNKTTEPTSNITHGPGINTLSTAAKSAEVAHNLIGKPQMPAQTAPMSSQNDVGRIRMKPRDPRRILHNNITQKSENSGADQMKSGGTVSLDAQITKDRSTVREQGEQAQTPSLPVQPNPLPDISRLFTKNLMNVADIVSSSQLSTSQIPPGSQVIAQPVPSVKNKDLSDTKTVAGTVPGLPLQGGTTGASANPWGDEDLGHLLNGYDDEQKAAIQKERARRIAEQNKMFAAKKLCLVLDLDHTLLNSAKFVEVDPVHEEILRKKEEQDREKPQRHLYRFQHMGMWTKLRPGIWNFLEKASKLFELHLYTMGNKLYATEMAKVLDPTGALFAGRVISKGDDGDPFDGDERVPKTKDLDGVLGMESAVVIIDDSVRVWPHNKLNLIVVERYTYFPCSRRQFGLLGPSLLEIDHDERPEDGTLASSLAVIERIHQSFFSHHSLHEIDVRNILAAEQRKILSGCRIVFSRVFPVGEVKPHLHPLWQTAEQFGAVCTNQIDEQVTHVVANSLGTDKVNWALSTGRFVVHPGWVEASALLYRRVNELDFTVKQ